MKIKESAENYLETIFMLKQKHGYVRSVDVAHELFKTNSNYVRNALVWCSQGIYSKYEYLERIFFDAVLHKDTKDTLVDENKEYNKYVLHLIFQDNRHTRRIQADQFRHIKRSYNPPQKEKTYQKMQFLCNHRSKSFPDRICQ